MEELRCALCGMDRGKMEAQHFVTVDVVDDQDREMLDATVQHHTLYSCQECRGKPRKGLTLLGCVYVAIVFWGSCLLFLLAAQYSEQILDWFPWSWIPFTLIVGVIVVSVRQWRTRSKLRKIATVRHGGPGPVRIFTLEQFEALQNQQK